MAGVTSESLRDAAIAALVHRTTAERGVPEQVTDPVTIAKLDVIFNGAPGVRDHRGAA